MKIFLGGFGGADREMLRFARGLRRLIFRAWGWRISGEVFVVVMGIFKVVLFFFWGMFLLMIYLNLARRLEVYV